MFLETIKNQRRLECLKTNAHPSFEKMADVLQAGFKLSLSEDDLELPTSTSQPLGIKPGASCKLGKHSTKRAIAPPQTILAIMSL